MRVVGVSVDKTILFSLGMRALNGRHTATVVLWGLDVSFGVDLWMSCRSIHVEPLDCFFPFFYVERDSSADVCCPLRRGTRAVFMTLSAAPP